MSNTINNQISNFDKLIMDYRKRSICGDIKITDFVAMDRVYNVEVATVATDEIIRDQIKPKQNIQNHKYMKIISWNINGLASAIKTNHMILHDLISKYQPDILCLQETKIQKENIPDYQNILEEYDSFWNCSTSKKGYSGTVMFIRKKGSILNHTANITDSMNCKYSNEMKSNTNISVLENILYDFENVPILFEDEGRTITAEFDTFFLVTSYFPNCGMDIRKLYLRTEQWDTQFQLYLQRLNKKKPVILTGDLNVVSRDIDISIVNNKSKNDEEYLCTRKLRICHKNLLNTSFQDAFRYFYPDAIGQFTQWSAENRNQNRGMRLDMFICSNSLFQNSYSSKNSYYPKDNDVIHIKNELQQQQQQQSPQQQKLLQVFDSYILHEFDQECSVSDHCPIVLVLELL